MIVVLMGVTGSGKTTIGTLLAQRTGTVFADADDYHPAANKEKMRAGIPLNDDDRQPWLEILNGLLRGWYQSGEGGVLACSALKEKYRQTLASGLPENAISFVWLDADKELLSERLAGAASRVHESEAARQPVCNAGAAKGCAARDERSSAGGDRRSDSGACFANRGRAGTRKAAD